MNTQDLVLNIAVNMGRICRFAMEKNEKRVEQFLDETQEYLNQLEIAQQSPKFEHTFQAFKQKFSDLKNNIQLNDEWAEDALTWANILTHRAKLA